MSTEPAEAPLRAASDAPPCEPPAKVSHKSFRRKYRKIMVNFEQKMNESTDYFHEEQKMMEITRRLAEQTDQLLDLLEDLNGRPQIPARLRYDLQLPETLQTSHPAPAEPYTIATAQSALKAARKRLRLGQISLLEYRDLECSILADPAFKSKISYTELRKLAPIPVSASADTTYDSSIASGGILSSRQEEEYLKSLDSFLSGSNTVPRPYAAKNSTSRGLEKSIEQEKEMQLRNPVSVYNWLRKHQPQVFLQDNESHVEKEKKSRPSKRTSTTLKLEPDDEDSVMADLGGSTSKGKRKRDDDAGYRPKGGNSRAKRRREDTGGSSRRSKKLSISEAARE